MNTSIRAVVFDADGTVLNTREFILKAFEHSAALHGHAVPGREKIVPGLAGKTLIDGYRALFPQGDHLALRDSHRMFQKEKFDLIAAYDGLHELLTTLRGRGMLLGICSSRAATVRPSLEYLEALNYFDAVVDANDVTEHKPHPEGVLKVLEILNIAPEHAAMIGDTVSDIEAGRAAGCAFTIGITHGFGTRESLENAGADHIIEKLSDILPLLT